ncbi:MAG: nucleoside-diphosphate sugar epimerase/dehydratase [Crocinitomicaceae bacterium]|nr:nucleoside-diphosphate sugar epimerase/dehydratase [Crocinitomicaceae bacterium]MDG1658103.1 nucleoside-diphosphate sugar epimerase/dehydratase [Crocinitomicaceae bacterium]MDG2440187.1 nucleoside-diphosphate sugar epimerase/dehydratase [Crocinitomicaceae bacterium]
MIDLFLSLVALFFAYVIRFDLKAEAEVIKEEWEILSKSILVYVGVKFFVFYLFKIHKGLVRHTSTEDLRRIFFASITSSLLFFILGLIRFHFIDEYYLFPTSVLLIEFLASFMLLLGLRFSIKLLYLESMKVKKSEERVLIYGAGISGLITKRTIEKDLASKEKIVGFLDDNKKLAGNRLEGKTIFHTSKLEKMLQEDGITRLIIAIQEPDNNNRKRIAELCIEYNVTVVKVPSTKSWINGEFSTKQLAKIKIDDLLGRKPINLGEDKIKKELNKEVILITGAAGSIGSGLVRQIAKYGPAKIILLDQAESPQYDLQNELRSDFPNLEFEVVIGDIRSYERMKNLLATFKPKFVFHAAAYKHVPLMESNPSEAVLTNVLGTRNLVDLSVEFGVYKFVMISTDKAVNPTNVMGASKRIAEVYAQAKNDLGKTKFITTRFGNVLGSNGSVIPLFQRQIANGGPLTVTDERVTRFFMTIPEACQLVLEAGVMGDGGEIFVFDMGESVKIIDLAKKMVKLSGLELGTDIEIKITGLRPGEKLYEELLAKDENTLPTHHPQILKATVRSADDQHIVMINDLIKLFRTQDNMEIVAKMKAIVPEFISNNSDFEKLDKHD